jgi:hypothetical protein
VSPSKRRRGQGYALTTTKYVGLRCDDHLDSVAYRKGSLVSGVTVVDYTWFIEEYMNGDYFLGVTFVRGLSPAEALHRIGATPGDVSRDWAIEAYAADGGVVLLDYHCYEMPEALSRGTETARLVTGTTMDEEFVYSVDGVVATRFEPSFPVDREGSDPDYLLAHMRDLGMWASPRIVEESA